MPHVEINSFDRRNNGKMDRSMQTATRFIIYFKNTHFLKSNECWKNPFRQMFAAFVRFRIALSKGMQSDTWKSPVDISYARVMKTSVLGVIWTCSLLGTVLVH